MSSRAAASARAAGARSTATAAAGLGAAVLLCGCAEALRWHGPARDPIGRWGDDVSGSRAGEHVVREGDTVYSIAFRNQLDFREVAAWNGIGPDYLIRPGQVLRLTPPPGPVAVQSAVPSRQPQLPTSGAAPPASGAGAIPTKAHPPGPVRWRWPLPGTVARSFAPQQGVKGIDIQGSLGQPVLAAAPGRVVYSGTALKGYGELVIIKHDELFLSAYGYNRRRLVREGDEVQAGQPIAELGLGPEQQPLLHFEIRERGKPVDPLRHLPQR